MQVAFRVQTNAYIIELAGHDYDMARGDYGTVRHENLFKFTQTTSGCDVAIGAPLITWHAPAVSRPSDRLGHHSTRLYHKHSPHLAQIHQLYSTTQINFAFSRYI